VKQAIAIHISEFLFEMDEDRAEGNVHDDRGDRKSWFHFSGAIASTELSVGFAKRHSDSTAPNAIRVAF